MADEKHIKNALLDLMNNSTDPDQAAKILARDTAHVRRLRRWTIFTWIVIGACFAGGAALEVLARDGDVASGAAIWHTGLAAMARMLSPFGLVLLVLLYVHSKNLTISQIQARLTQIEKLLREMAHGDSVS